LCLKENLLKRAINVIDSFRDVYGNNPPPISKKKNWLNFIGW
jgi:hypothetical protein